MNQERVARILMSLESVTAGPLASHRLCRLTQTYYVSADPLHSRVGQAEKGKSRNERALMD